MGLEILFNRYLIIETGTEECGNHMHFIHPKDGENYGPYFIRKRAERKLEAIKDKRIKEGWKQNPFEENLLFRVSGGLNHIRYNLETVSHKII